MAWWVLGPETIPVASGLGDLSSSDLGGSGTVGTVPRGGSCVALKPEAGAEPGAAAAAETRRP